MLGLLAYLNVACLQDLFIYQLCLGFYWTLGCLWMELVGLSLVSKCLLLVHLLTCCVHAIQIVSRVRQIDQSWLIGLITSRYSKILLMMLHLFIMDLIWQLCCIKVNRICRIVVALCNSLVVRSSCSSSILIGSKELWNLKLLLVRMAMIVLILGGFLIRIL